MEEIPKHWKHYYEENEGRGWVDPKTHERIVAPFKNEFDVQTAPKLEINNDSLERLRVLLLNLGIDDNNIFVAKLYFELARRSMLPSFHDKEKGIKIWNISQAHMSPKELEDILNDINKRLPIEESEYIELAKILGVIIIRDNNIELDKSSRRHFISNAQTFLYLQRRAKMGNGYELNDDELKNIEDAISQIVKDYDPNERTSVSAK